MKRKILSLSTFATLGGIALFQNPVYADSDSIEVKRGDSLWSLSKTYKTTVTALKQANGLTSNNIYAGQKLKIPNFNESSTSQSQLKPSAPVVQTETETYTVQDGDSLWKIATQFNMTVSELKAMNLLRSDTIYVGQSLKLTKASAQNETKTEQSIQQDLQSSPSSSSINSQIETTNNDTYTVQTGDTLWKIAQRFNMTTSELKNLNLLRSDTVYVNQILKLKSDFSAPSTEETGQVNNPAEPPATKVSINVTQLIDDAKAVMGTPYKWGGSSLSGFDCSGLIYYVLNKQTSSKRVNTAYYWSQSTAVSEPQIGDFVFFSTYAPGPSHLGIYIGNRQFIHAGSSTGVTISSLDNTYWKGRYLGSKRFLQ